MIETFVTLLIPNIITFVIAAVVSYTAYRILRLQNTTPFLKVLLSLITAIILQDIISLLFGFPLIKQEILYNILFNLISVVFFFYITKAYLNLLGRKRYIFWIILSVLTYGITYFT